MAFISSATNLVTGDSNERNDAFVRDRLLRTTQRISLLNDRTQFSEGGVTEVAISANGRFAAFVVETSSGFQKNEGGLYVRDLLLRTTKRLITTIDGEPYPGSISISGDGRRIAYSLYEQSATQVHMIDRLTSAIQLVSVSHLGTVRPESSSSSMISEDGRFVVFESEAAGLVEGGETMHGGLFIRDLLKNTTQRVDLANDVRLPTARRIRRRSVPMDGSWRFAVSRRTCHLPIRRRRRPGRVTMFAIYAPGRLSLSSWPWMATNHKARSGLLHWSVATDGMSRSNILSRTWFPAMAIAPRIFSCETHAPTPRNCSRDGIRGFRRRRHSPTTAACLRRSR